MGKADAAGPTDGRRCRGRKRAGRLPQVAAVREPIQFVTLGSLDPTTGYRMLVTLTNTGAAVRRAEMTSPRYLDQHDW